jgi:hypothetical protein
MKLAMTRPPWVEPGSGSTLLFQLRNSESPLFASALIASQSLARSVDEMNACAGKTCHGFIFVIHSGFEPVLHVLVGYGADEDEISRPAVVLASVHVLYASDWSKVCDSTINRSIWDTLDFYLGSWGWPTDRIW